MPADSDPSIFGLPAGCGHCGAPLALVNTSTNGSLTVGILGCTSCNREWEVTCRIVPHRFDPRLRKPDRQRQAA